MLIGKHFSVPLLFFKDAYTANKLISCFMTFTAICGKFSPIFLNLPVQVCEQCPNVKYVREGYFVTVDIEKGMQDGQVIY